MCLRDYAIKDSHFSMDNIIHIFSQYLKLNVFRNWRQKRRHITVKVLVEKSASSVGQFDETIYQMWQSVEKP